MVSIISLFAGSLGLKILIVDDHDLFRKGLSLILSSLDKNIIVIEASGCDSANQQVSDNPDLDLVLLDLNLPGKDGFAALDNLSRKYPTLPIAIISASKKRDDMKRALDSGAVGYIPKETKSSILLNTLQLIMAGGIYIPPDMAYPHNINKKDSANIASHFNLTPRQNEVLVLLVDGSSNKKIAEKLNLTESTVKVHITSIFKAMNVKNRTQAAMAAERHQLSNSEY